MTYGNGGRWGTWSDAWGSNLELIDPRADNSLAPNWADSDETHKAPWASFRRPGRDTTADQLQVLLHGGRGMSHRQCASAFRRRQPRGQRNLNPNATGWTRKAQNRCRVESTGRYNSTHSYHVRAVDKVVTIIKSTESRATDQNARGGTQNVTIRAAARWLKGSPEILLRLRERIGWNAGRSDVAAQSRHARRQERPLRKQRSSRDCRRQTFPGASAANQEILVTARVKGC